jgi:hypothetical protein
MEGRVELYSDHIQGQQLQIKQLEQVIDNLNSKVNNYDAISPF